MKGFQLEKGERLFLYTTVVVLVAFFLAIIGSITEAGIHLPGDEGQIDPALVSQTAPFNDLSDRARDIDGDPALEAVLIANAYAFQPNPIIVPAGTEIEFITTSTDVIHGFLVANTNLNAMIIPGQVTKITYTFDEPGEHTIICHEFCGIGHPSMFGTIIVEGGTE